MDMKHQEDIEELQLQFQTDLQVECIITQCIQCSHLSLLQALRQEADQLRTNSDLKDQV